MSAVLDHTVPPSPAQEFWRGFAANQGALAALFVFSLITVACLFAPLVAPHDPIEQFRDACWRRRSGPGGSTRFFAGTDELGRDMLSRLLHGAGCHWASAWPRCSCPSMIPGVLLGLVAAFFDRWASPAIMRVMDIVLALPGLLLAIA